MNGNPASQGSIVKHDMKKKGFSSIRLSSKNTYLFKLANMISSSI